jgi:copper chaperone
METLKFKTNIKCGGCIATVTPVLNNLEGINKWDVDVNNPDKVLTVETKDAGTETKLVNALKQKGYNAEKI